MKTFVWVVIIMIGFGFLGQPSLVQASSGVADQGIFRAVSLAVTVETDDETWIGQASLVYLDDSSQISLCSVEHVLLRSLSEEATYTFSFLQYESEAFSFALVRSADEVDPFIIVDDEDRGESLVCYQLTTADAVLLEPALVEADIPQRVVTSFSEGQYVVMANLETINWEVYQVIDILDQDRQVILQEQGDGFFCQGRSGSSLLAVTRKSDGTFVFEQTEAGRLMVVAEVTRVTDELERADGAICGTTVVATWPTQTQ